MSLNLGIKEYVATLYTLAEATPYHASMRGELFGHGQNVSISAKINVSDMGTNYLDLLVGDIYSGFLGGKLNKNIDKTVESTADTPDYFGYIETGVGDDRLHLAAWRLKDPIKGAGVIMISAMPLVLSGKYAHKVPTIPA